LRFNRVAGSPHSETYNDYFFDAILTDTRWRGYCDFSLLDWNDGCPPNHRKNPASEDAGYNMPATGVRGGKRSSVAGRAIQ
jgi:hypothetical protein